MDALIGATIALISKSEIRYVGTLHQVDKANATVSLRDVRSFGTEGRLRDPSKEIPPGPQVFSLIMFKGSDIKDLSVLDANQSAPKPVAAAPVAPPVMPPPISQEQPNLMSQNQPHHLPFQGFPPQQMPFGMMPPNMNPYLMQQAMSYGQQSHFWPQPPNMPGFAGFPGMPTHGTPFNVPMPNLNPMAQKHEIPVENKETKPEPKPEPLAHLPGLDSLTKNLGNLNVTESSVKPSQEQVLSVEKTTKITSIMEQKAAEKTRPAPVKTETKTANLVVEKVEKTSPTTRGRGRGSHSRGRRDQPKQIIPKSDYDFEKANAKFNKEDVSDAGQPKEDFYSKSSFFDDISCETKDRQVQMDPHDRKVRIYEERRLNMETFGQVSAHRGRGRGRGRGNYRGGYRNDYRNDSRNDQRPHSTKKQGDIDQPGK